MNPLHRQIRVLIVDDSALVRRDLSAWLTADANIEIVGVAGDPYVARAQILRHHPDVLLLDLGLPRMDGLTFLKALMEHHPMPIIVVSGLVEPGSSLAIKALEAGAFDVFHKPEGELSVSGMSRELISKIHAAARFSPPKGNKIAGTRAEPVAERPVRAERPAPVSIGQFDPRQFLLIGASTGGTEAIRDVLTALPATVPGIAIVQHIPANFSRAFAERLNRACAFEVREAEDGDVLHAGLALVAPGGYHLRLERQRGQMGIRLDLGPQVHHQRPAVDVLFQSAAVIRDLHVVAVLLTGMGADGAAGMKLLRERGATTLVQNEESCVVFGMPQAAIKLGGVQHVVALQAMPQMILRQLERARVRL